ncbi:EpsG family protein [Ornithobacterium rhinotracheale]|uniref:EpsG family protein n=1 Tax=Ornithobacterium rhinotracheale TaxID=28251 RepID=UPI00129C6374|nr:EpsG family protein [Ornithobacterium rhinotracheale]MRJ09474.1 EpsG family protein [Ornithobacterium rhinotracheale]
MLPYLFIFALALIVYFSNPLKNKKLVYFFLVCLMLITGLRDMIGGYDVYIYAEVFETTRGKLLYLFTPFEKGFLSYYYLLQQISGKREFLFFASAVILYGLHFFVIKKNTENISISLFVYFCKFFIYSFVYLRQGLAMAVIWLSISLIINKKYFYSLLIIALAFTLHRSSIIFLPFVFVANRKFNNYQLLLVGFIVLFLSFSPLGNALKESTVESINIEKASGYIDKDSGVNIFYLIEALALFILGLKFRASFYQTPKGIAIFNGFALYVFFTLATLTNASFLRLTWYYFIFLVLAIPYMYNAIKDIKLRNFFKLCLGVYFGATFIRLLILWDSGDLMPYKSIFQDFNRNGRFEFMEYRQNYPFLN